jgi:hypothetical protein
MERPSLSARAHLASVVRAACAAKSRMFAVTVHILGQVMQRGTQVPEECQVWEARREQVLPAGLPHTQP